MYEFTGTYILPSDLGTARHLIFADIPKHTTNSIQAKILSYHNKQTKKLKVKKDCFKLTMEVIEMNIHRLNKKICLPTKELTK